MLIVSEQRAHEIAQMHGRGQVVCYEHRPSRLTLFAVILPGNRVITHDPRGRVTSGDTA